MKYYRANEVKSIDRPLYCKSMAPGVSTRTLKRLLKKKAKKK